MTQFAAYDDLSIYAIASSPEQAIAKARTEAMDPTAQFETAMIDDVLAAWIEENGWNGKHRSFEVRQGVILDTTSEDEGAGDWTDFNGQQENA
jgi:hypothetical protein